MRYCISFLLLSTLFFIYVEAQPPTQVTVETKFVEVQQHDLDELGFEFGIGPSIGTFTNQMSNDIKPVVGINAFGGVNIPINPILSVNTHLNVIQYGNRNTYQGNSYTFKVSTLGLDGGVVVNLVPELRVVPFVTAGGNIGLNLAASQKTEIAGIKTKNRIEWGDQDNRFFAGLFGGAGVTVRTDVGDLSAQVVVLGGLTELGKNNTERSVPLLFNIPLIYRFFGKREKTRERNNLILLVTPRIIENSED